MAIEEPKPTLLSRWLLKSVYAAAADHQPEKARVVAGNDCKMCKNICHGRVLLATTCELLALHENLSQSLMLSAFGIALPLTFPLAFQAV